MTIFYEKHQHRTTTGDFTRKYGSFSISWSLKQENLESYKNSQGIVRYRDFQNTRFVLGDPFCDKSKNFQLLSDFDAECDSCCFLQVSQNTAESLDKLGYSVNHFGVESILHLPYSLEGKNKREIRNLYNAAEHRRLTVKEISLHKFNIIKFRFRKNHEFHFLIRPYDLGNQKECRFFCAFDNEHMVSLLIFDPIYLDGKIVGYAESINRRISSTPKGARVYTLLKAADKFYSEGIKFINLGLLPFYPPDYNRGEYFKTNAVTINLFKLLYNTSPFFHNFEGLSFHKSRYNGHLLPKYFASKKKIPIVQLLHIYKLTTGSYLPRIYY